MKWYLNVLIKRSAALRRCITWGASCKFISFDLSSIWKAREVSLPNLVYSGFSLLVSR